MPFGVKLNKKGNTDMKKVLTMKNYRVMKNYMKYICAFLMMVGISTNAWGAESSFDVSSITVNSVDWGTSTTSLSKYIGYDNGSIVTSSTKNEVWFQLYLGDEFDENSLYAVIEDPTDGLGISMTVAGVNPAEYYDYVGYVDNSGNYLPYHSNIEVDLQYVITSPRTSHTATLKFKTYEGYDLVDVLSIPITINMTGGYTVATAVSPSATGSVTAKVGGSAKTHVKSDEKLDLVATPEDGYMFTGWSASDESNIIFDDEDAASTFAYLSGNQTITATFDVACTSRSITMSDFSKDFGSEDFVPTHTVSAGSGTKIWTSSNTDVATIVDGKVHIVAAGTTTIGLSVAADDPYCAVSKNCTMTVNALVPTVTAFTGTSTTPTSITLTNAQVSNKGGAAITAYGYIYSTTASTTEALKLGESGVSTATVASADIAASTNFASKTVSELTTGTTYYVRAYATNSAGTGYSAIQSVKTIAYTDYKFSCADWTLTGPSGDIVFITSAANKTVRSQEAFHVSGNGLPHETALTFTTFPVNAKFEFKKADGSAISTDEYGVVDADVYVFYTPGVGDTSDGLDEITSLTVSVTGEPRTATIATKRVIGRHLPADFVIAGKKDGKWYALPADFSEESTPAPIEIAVDDINNPGIAYTANTNIYNLYGQNSGVGYLYNDGDSDGNPDGEKIKLGMKNNGNKPLFAFASPSNALKGDGTATVTNNIGKQYWWTLKQTNTSIDNPQDAKYTITSSNNPGTLSIKNSPFAWGTYKSGVEELRLVPASSATPTEAEIVAWGKNEAIIEVDQPTISATSVIGKLPGDIASSKITLSQTGTSVKGTGTRYDYTVDFGDDVDFSANEGKMLTLEWYNGESLVAVSNVTVPRIVASNTTLNSSNFTNKSVWNTEVHVLPGDTLTIDASGYANKDVTIKELHVYPGAAVVINTDTLKVTNLVLRSGWSRIGEKSYGVGSLYIKPGTGYGSMKATNAYMDWYIDYDQYYPIAVPWSVTTANISYQNMTVATSAGLIVRHYDGERHAKGGDGNTNWKAYTWGVDMPATLTPGIGYAITARRPAGKAFSIIRMPLTIPSAAWTKDGEQGEVSETHKDQVLATAWVKDEGETPDHAKGWNFIANPYMCTYQGAITHSKDAKYNIKFVNIPDVDFKEFDQVTTATAKLKPGSGFLIQTEETGTLTFGTTNRKASMPSYFAEVPQVLDQQAYILLNGNGAVDQMGLFISDIYTAEYEINADLEKLLSDGNTLRTYMRYGDLNMAYVAINAELAQEWIPVTVRVPASNQYTFSLHEASEVGEMEGIYLIDYESNTITNLIENNYSFVAAGGTVEGRFAINAIAGQHETPTDIDIIQGGGNLHSDQPFKFLYHDKVFIYHRGVIYDATGKKVREINK